MKYFELFHRPTSHPVNNELIVNVERFTFFSIFFIDFQTRLVQNIVNSWLVWLFCLFFEVFGLSDFTRVPLSTLCVKC